jgi:hypothetical protein
MKKLFLLAFLFFQTCGPDPEPPIPNPGFRVITENEVLVGNVFPTYIPYPSRGSVTQGGFRGQLVGHAPYTGTVDSFLSTSNMFGNIDVQGGKAAALWYMTAVSGWNGCEGQSTFIEALPGQALTLICTHRGTIHIPIYPSAVDQNGAPIELRAYVGGVDTTYGMPVFHFEDYTGQLIATATATSVSGDDIRINSDDLMDKSLGMYSIKIYNAPTSSGDRSPPLAYSSIEVQTPTSCPGDHHCPIGKIWDPEFCYCVDEWLLYHPAPST